MATAAAVTGTTEASFGNLRHTALSAFWFGSNFLWIPLTTVLIQSQVDAVVSKGSQNGAIGFAIGIGGFLAMTVPPLVGAWSDRLNTRFGRRRPIMVAGTLLTIPGLILLMTAGNYPQIVVGYAIVQFFFNAAGAAYAGIIPDVVPAQQFGKASGFLATMTQLGIGGGLGVSSLMGSTRAIYLVFIAVILITLVPTIWAARNEGLAPIAPHPRRSLAEAISEFLRPLHEGDFAWVVFTRLMISAGITAVLYNLHNFFRDVVLTPGTNPDAFTSNWLLVVVVTALPFGFFGGLLSDRWHRRKAFVYLSGGAQAFVAIVFIAFYPTAIPFVFGLGVAYGVGYGLYFAVDWALACDTLPDKSQSAKDMGLFHIALTMPQAVIPFFGGPLIDYLNGPHGNSGYRIVFSSAVVFLFVGTVLVSRIKSVR
ncbi:MAG TPA: MFS transporter [Candidatus Acidoferrum sp.]|jgi:MFS family permease|nr:MFS transporter [Candidatus Acidoferrum sp.]